MFRALRAFFRWPAATEADGYVAGMIHVANLFTTLARVAGGLEHLPTDRVIDGVVWLKPG